MMFATVTAAGQWLRLADPDTDPDLEHIVEAVNAYVATLPGVYTAHGTATKPATLGAVMLAARLHRRRNSPNGIESITDTGVAYAARTDSDIARLLGIDAHLRPKVG